MLKFRWFFLTILGVLLACLPLEARQLLFWRYDANQNQLTFTTDAGVQPKAQLIPNPTRLVIDLPGTTLGRPTVNQAVGNVIRSVRAGQFDAQTTRLVVELAPGYTVDPNQIKFRGIAANQWVVTLPAPQRITTSAPLPPSTRPSPSNPPTSSTPPATSTPNSPDFRVTRNGLLISISGGSNRDIRINRSRDRRTIDIDLKGAQFPAQLQSQTFPVNDYKITDVKLSQVSTSLARVTLNVSPDSPDWQATISSSGSLVLFPRGGLERLSSGARPGPISPNPGTTPPPSASTSGQGVIQAVDLAAGNQQLLIRSNQPIQSRGYWNRATRTYEITLSNATLADNFRGPQLNANSPISRLRVRQQNANTVVLLIELAPGVEPQQLGQLGSQQIALGLNAPQIIPVPPPERPAPNFAPTQPTPNPSVPQGSVLVVIDPGHGGKDPGTIGIGGVREKDIVLPLSTQVANYLQSQGVTVRMTRTSDYFVSLAGRTQLANRINANLFVSIHANAINLSRPDVNGLETYYYQNGRGLAATIHSNILRNINIRDRRVRQARFYVLRHSRMPSVLVEVGFLTGREDAPRLKTAGHRQQMASAIAQGIMQYIQQNRI